MQIGVIGLGTMGANLARNAARNGAKVAVFNRTEDTMHAFMRRYGKEGNIVPCKTYGDIARSLSTPRVFLIMVKAGEAVDQVIEDLIPYLDSGDILIDGGNSHYADTQRRCEYLAQKQVSLIGMGVSGGEQGALEGPSLMPGGDRKAYDFLEPLLKSMAADDGLGGKCVSYIGPGGAGHFVKMVHNGIEYGLMQLLAEAYDVLRKAGKYSNEELAETFTHWNEGDDLRSFLMEITASIFDLKDGVTGGSLLDVIKDAAGQKGTGKWTTLAAMELGVAIPTINAAVDARIISGSPDLRLREDRLPYTPDLEEPMPPRHQLRSMVRASLHLSSLCTYKQGFQMLEAASREWGWKLDLSEVARIWLGGCIIRSVILKVFMDVLGAHPARVKTAQNVLHEYLRGERQVYWRLFQELASSRGIPIPAMAASLSYYDAIRSEKLPQNLIQAQRDFFGAHGFERTDRDGVFHIHSAV
ncbi:NADP-dependent phosphogluconate dehydrogenase [Candidatus Peregrinibacteria bacterium]|nr:NADP-dependent phosphogluconate dehydrogenase [Candidatus Peregrinibacteria bacterium]